MASMKNLPPCPDNLKPMLHYIKAAVEHDNRDPVVAYWLRFHAVQVGIRIDGKSKPAKTFISAVMDTLEMTKKGLKGNEAVTTDIVAQAHIENYALKLFNWADAEDRAGHFDKNVIKAFYTAGLLFDVLAVWGDVGEEVVRQQKYAKWKAAYIHNCLKNGEIPISGPQTEGGDPEGLDDEQLGGHDLNSMTTSQSNNSMTNSVSGGPSAYDKLFLPPGVPAKHDPNTGPMGFQPTIFPSEQSTAKPPNQLPIAPPRGAAVRPPVQTPSPLADRKGGSITNQMGTSLNADDVAKAQKNMKHAASALQFDDVNTAIDLLERTLSLLKTGKE